MVIGFFPDANASVLSQISDGLTPFRTAMAAANWFFPVGTFFTVLGIVITIELSIMTYKLVMFVVKNVSLGLFKT